MSMMQQGLISLASLEVMLLSAQEGNDGQAERKFIKTLSNDYVERKTKLLKIYEKEIL